MNWRCTATVPLDGYWSSISFRCLLECPGPGVGERSTAAYVPSAATITHVYVAVRDYVVCIKRGVRLDVIRMQSPVLDISVPPDDHPLCAIVRCRHEVVAIWQDPTENRLELLDDTMLAAVCGCTRDGHVVLADGQHFDVYVRGDGNFDLLASGSSPLDTPLAILPRGVPNQILVLCRNGAAELLNVK